MNATERALEKRIEALEKQMGAVSKWAVALNKLMKDYMASFKL